MHKKISGVEYLLVSKDGMEIEYCLFFFLGKLPSFNVRPQVIRPP